MTAIIMLIIFFVIMIGIGIWGMRKTTSLADFFLAGRSIGPWISAMAYGTTYFSAVVFIGFAGKFGWGLGIDVLWIIMGNALFGALAAWFVLGRRTRLMTQNLDTMTMPEFLQERYAGKYLKLASAAIIFIFLVPYCASIFKGLGHLFEANFDISYDIALLIMVGITGIYMILGGYFAITLTECIQGLIMLFVAIAMVAVLIGNAGGLFPSMQAVQEAYHYHTPAAAAGTNWLLLFSLVFMTSFGTWGLPHMIQRFYAIKNAKVIPKAAIATTLFSFIIVFSAYYTGALSHIFYRAPGQAVMTAAPSGLIDEEAAAITTGGEPAAAIAARGQGAALSPDHEAFLTRQSGLEVVPTTAAGGIDFDRIVPDMLYSVLPEFLMALVLLLVLSASMSSLSTLVLVSASAVAIDMYKGHIKPDISKEKSVAAMRLLSGVFIIMSFFLARYEFSLIVTLMSLSWGAVAGSFMAPFLYGLYWKRTTRTGAAAGMATGLTLSITLFFVLGPANAPIASTIAMIAPFIVVPVVSVFTARPDDALLARAFTGIGRRG